MFDLRTLKEFAEELGYHAVFCGEDILEVHAGESIVLEFVNMPADDDTLVGFKGTPWHYHGEAMFGTGHRTYVELDELSARGRT